MESEERAANPMLYPLQHLEIRCQNPECGNVISNDRPGILLPRDGDAAGLVLVAQTAVCSWQCCGALAQIMVENGSSPSRSGQREGLGSQ